MVVLTHRTTIIAVVGIILGIVVTISWHTVGSSGPARLEVDRETHNWGKVIPGSEVSTTFEIHNRGGEPLHFDEPSTSCGCTTSQLTTSSLGPGEQTQLTVSFRVPENPGPVGHFVRLISNDPDHPQYELSLFAEAWTGVRPEPQSIDLGRMKAGEEIERTIHLYSPDGKPFRIGRVSSDLSLVECVAESPDAPLPVHVLRVTYRSEDRLGALHGKIRVVTDRPDAPFVNIPLAGQTVGSISVSPQMLQLERDEIGLIVKRTALLRVGSQDAEALKPLNVQANAPWDLISYSTRRISNECLAVELSLKMPEGSGAESGELLLFMGGSTPTTYYHLPLTVRGWLAPLPQP